MDPKEVLHTNQEGMERILVHAIRSTAIYLESDLTAGDYREIMEKFRVSAEKELPPGHFNLYSDTDKAWLRLRD